MDVQLNQSLLILFNMLAADVCFEVIKPGPPLPRRAVTRLRTRGANISYLVSDAWRGAVDGLAVSLQVVLCREALRTGTAGLMAVEGFCVLKFVLPTLC